MQYKSMKSINIIRRPHSTKIVKNALTFFNRQTLNATESSIFEPTMSLMHDISEFHISMYPYIIRDAISRKQCKELYPVVKRFDDMCYYTGPERELFPSLVLLNSYKTLEVPDKLTLENLKLASILAWCFEMVTTGFILEDDIMDNTKIRWKKMCYHKQKEIGLTSLTDTKKLYMSAFRILKKYFGKTPFYAQLMNLMCKLMFVTSLGQSTDININNEFQRSRNLNVFSYNKYKEIVKFKTGFILYKAPPLAAMYLAKTNSMEFLNSFFEICDKFSVFRQMQDDMWDVYGDFNYYGKIGNDISNGKCTWLIVTAVQHANKHQLLHLHKHYGQNHLDSQNIVKQVYKEIDVLGKFAQYKYKLIEELKSDIQSISFKPICKLCYDHVECYININEHFVDYYTAAKRNET